MGSDRATDQTLIGNGLGTAGFGPKVPNFFRRLQRQFRKNLELQASLISLGWNYQT